MDLKEITSSVIPKTIVELGRICQDVQEPVQMMLTLTLSFLSQRVTIQRTHKTSTLAPESKAEIAPTLALLPPLVNRFNDCKILTQYLWGLIHCKRLMRHTIAILTPSTDTGTAVLAKIHKMLSKPMQDLILGNNAKCIAFKDKTDDSDVPMKNHMYLSQNRYSSIRIASLNAAYNKGFSADVVVGLDVSRQEMATFVTPLLASLTHAPLVICLWSGPRNIEFNQTVAEPDAASATSATSSVVETKSPVVARV